MLPNYNFGGLNDSMNAPLIQQQPSNPYQTQPIPVANPVVVEPIPVEPIPTQKEPQPVEMAQPVQPSQNPLDYLMHCINLK